MIDPIKIELTLCNNGRIKSKSLLNYNTPESNEGSKYVYLIKINRKQESK